LHDGQTILGDPDQHDALTRSAILGSPPERAFDAIATEAAAACGAPVAVVSFVDGARAWCKAAHGIGADPASAHLGLARLTQNGLPFVVPDALADGRLPHDPAFPAPTGIRAFAGAPITLGGTWVGTVSVADAVPRGDFTACVRHLQRLARLASLLLEVRLASLIRLGVATTTTTRGAWITDVEGRTTFVDDSVAAMLGSTPEEMLGRPVASFAPAEDREEVGRRFTGVHTGSTVAADVVFERPDGERRTIEASSASLVEIDGTFDGNVTLLHDVTEHRRAGSEALERDHLFTSVVESLSGMAYQCELRPNYGMRFVSGGCAELTGYKPEELVDGVTATFDTIVHPDDHGPVVATLTAAADALESFEVDFRIRHRDGTTRWLSEHGRCWLAADGQTVIVDGVIVDVTQKVLAAREVERAAVNFQHLVEHAPDAMVLASAGRILFGNAVAAEVFGLTVDDMVGLSIQALIDPLQADGPAPDGRHTQDVGLALYRIGRPEGDDGAIVAHGVAVRAEGTALSQVELRDVDRRPIDPPAPPEHATVLAAIAANRPLAETLDRLATMVEGRIRGTRCAILTLTGTTLHLGAAPTFPPELCEAMNGVEIGPAVGSCGSAAFLREPVIAGDIATDTRWTAYRDLFLPHGFAACWSVPIVATSTVLGTFALYRSVTGEPSDEDRRLLDTFVDLAAVAIGHANAMSRMAYEATHDALTGLPNRRQAVDLLQDQLDQARVTGTAVAVGFADLDDFKLVNDRLGRSQGDDVLRKVADRLSGAVRDGDLLARFSGDEFVIFCPGIKPDSDLDSLPRRVERALADAIDVDGNKVFVRASVGVAVSQGSCDAEQLLADASAAMYQAKDAGRGGSQRFDESLRQVAHRRGRLENQLRNAIDNHEIKVAYQPIVEMTTGHIVGAEALARWTTADGPIGPDEFIPVAERTGLILALGTQILLEAATEAATWMAASDGPRYVSVNLSTRQLADPTLVATVAAVLEQTGLAPELLCLELTETAVMDDPNGAAKVLRALKDLGLKLAVDDFGTGYSSLTHLRRFPVDYLKVDRSFVNNVTLGGDDTTIVAAVAGLAANLGLDVVAEGVELAEQTGELARLGCAYGQGYLWSRPKPAAEFRALLALEA
jgi:diguanylate cyclase (GGDEF)-like protein/PAS domain S-box-containing protein